MYYDLHVPYRTPDVAPKKKGKDKGKAKEEEPKAPPNCWAGLSATERADVARKVSLAGHLGYTVIAYTITAEQSPNVIPSPFGGPDDRSLPYPSLDPRYADLAGPSQPTLVQVTRYHMRLDDGKVNPITATNTATLRDYDLLSVHVGCDKALQVACTDLANPGPNQISIISVPLHERPYHFRLNRKQIRQAQRNGVVFEIPYAAGLFPSKSVPSDIARRYRQNFLTNARELVRVTGGKDIIFTSGPGGAPDGIRGPLDVVNLATILGVPANLAKDALSRTPKAVLLRAQARRTYKAVVSTPRLVPGPGEQSEGDKERAGAEQATTDTKDEANGDKTDSKADSKQKRPGEPAGGVKKKTKK